MSSGFNHSPCSDRKDVNKPKSWFAVHTACFTLESNCRTGWLVKRSAKYCRMAPVCQAFPVKCTYLSFFKLRRVRLNFHHFGNLLSLRFPFTQALISSVAFFMRSSAYQDMQKTNNMSCNFQKKIQPCTHCRNWIGAAARAQKPLNLVQLLNGKYALHQGLWLVGTAIAQSSGPVHGLLELEAWSSRVLHRTYQWKGKPSTWWPRTANKLNQSTADF